MQLRAQRLIAFKAGHRHIQNRLQPLRLNTLDDISADPGFDRLAHHAWIVLVGEHHDGTWLITADQHHLLHHVATWRFSVNEDDVRAHGLNARGQVDDQSGFVDHVETGLYQS